MYTHTHAFSLPGASDVHSHTSPWWSMSVSVCAYQCRLCSAAGGLWRVRGERVGEGVPPLDARLVFTLAVLHPPRPCPCWLLKQTKASLLVTSARSGTYHSAWTGLAATAPSAEWGHCGERACWLGLAWLGLLMDASESFEFGTF